MCVGYRLLFAGVAVLAVAACGGDGDDAPGALPAGRIAFTSNSDGQPQTYVMNADGSGAVNLTNDQASNSEPWWSPDGSQIAFQSSRGGQPDIFIMNADGSNVRQLTRDPAVDGGLRWSPDGSKVAYYSFADDSSGFLWVANVDGSDGRPILQSIHPAGAEAQCAGGFPGGWFADGKRILYRGSNGASKALQICSVNADGTDAQVIYTEPNTLNFFPALSPDGSRIAFVSNRDGNNEIYLMDVDGKNLQRLTDDAGDEENPSWSPDGRWIAFASNRDGDYEVFVVGRDGKGLRQLTNNSFDDSEPAWSPR